MTAAVCVALALVLLVALAVGLVERWTAWYLRDTPPEVKS